MDGHSYLHLQLYRIMLKHDPFYFGELLQSFLRVLIISTLGLWDVVMRVNIYGCDVNPSLSGYPLSPEYPCEDPKAFGYFAAFFVGMVVVFEMIADLNL